VFASENASLYLTPPPGRPPQNDDAYSNPKVDSLFDQANTELNAGKAAGIYNQIDQQLWADMVNLPLYQDPTFIAYGNDYVNIGDNPSPSGPFWNAEQWGFKPSAQSQ
jgi:peptide/nickel transport system substrate-binding protein